MNVSNISISKYFYTATELGVDSESLESSSSSSDDGDPFRQMQKHSRMEKMEKLKAIKAGLIKRKEFFLKQHQKDIEMVDEETNPKADAEMANEENK